MGQGRGHFGHWPAAGDPEPGRSWLVWGEREEGQRERERETRERGCTELLQRAHETVQVVLCVVLLLIPQLP